VNVRAALLEGPLSHVQQKQDRSAENLLQIAGAARGKTSMTATKTGSLIPNDIHYFTGEYDGLCMVLKAEKMSNMLSRDRHRDIQREPKKSTFRGMLRLECRQQSGQLVTLLQLHCELPCG
jgi:hypothetical protein